MAGDALANRWERSDLNVFKENVCFAIITSP